MDTFNTQRKNLAQNLKNSLQTKNIQGVANNTNDLIDKTGETSALLGRNIEKILQQAKGNAEQKFIGKITTTKPKYFSSNGSITFSI